MSARVLAILLSLAAPAGAADRPGVPGLPVKPLWSVDLSAAVAAGPVNDGDRIYLALRTANVTALSLSGGREIWRIARTVTTPMDASGGLLFFSVVDAVEAVRGSDGASAWLAPRLKATAPLVSTGDVLIVATNTELVALDVKNGQVRWRLAAGGIKQAPVVAEGRVFAGADDGRVVAVDLASGKLAWEKYIDQGVSSIAAHRDRVYAGGGDKQFHCLDAAKGSAKWHRRIGSIPSGAIAVDDERVYFTALDNVVRALDRTNGNQRWQAQLSKRPIGGVRLVGHVVFVQASGSELLMLYDRTGAPSGTIAMPGETARDTPPDVRETKAGLNVLVVTGGLSNQWQLTLVGPAYEEPVTAFAAMAIPGLPFLGDPELAPMGRILRWLILGDPPVGPLSRIGWPLVMQDPPLEPLTTIPGLQLRPLSPVLPVRRGA